MLAKVEGEEEETFSLSHFLLSSVLLPVPFVDIGLSRQKRAPSSAGGEEGQDAR